ncbi:hypothetical protein NPIL_242291 [Nephila pilipes]|uniref:Uncharacterized protein n=1 Tax=Nephila pilipes TaxID=299642 RepID=A0A8X6QTI1_NEPPI|nr:hypothetical protein NPIL_242291 [Nephila pilipes]
MLEENKDYNSGLRWSIAGHDPKSGRRLELRSEVLIPPKIRLLNVGEAGEIENNTYYNGLVDSVLSDTNVKLYGDCIRYIKSYCEGGEKSVLENCQKNGTSSFERPFFFTVVLFLPQGERMPEDLVSGSSCFGFNSIESFGFAANELEGGREDMLGLNHDERLRIMADYDRYPVNHHWLNLLSSRHSGGKLTHTGNRHPSSYSDLLTGRRNCALILRFKTFVGTSHIINELPLPTSLDRTFESTPFPTHPLQDSWDHPSTLAFYEERLFTEKKHN